MTIGGWLDRWLVRRGGGGDCGPCLAWGGGWGLGAAECSRHTPSTTYNADVERGSIKVLTLTIVRFSITPLLDWSLMTGESCVECSLGSDAAARVSCNLTTPITCLQTAAGVGTGSMLLLHSSGTPNVPWVQYITHSSAGSGSDRLRWRATVALTAGDKLQLL